MSNRNTAIARALEDASKSLTHAAKQLEDGEQASASIESAVDILEEDASEYRKDLSGEVRDYVSDGIYDELDSKVSVVKQIEQSAYRMPDERERNAERIRQLNQKIIEEEAKKKYGERRAKENFEIDD